MWFVLWPMNFRNTRKVSVYFLALLNDHFSICNADKMKYNCEKN